VSVRSWVLLFFGLLFFTPHIAAQTRADSANTVLDAARILKREGRDDAARQLLQFIRARYGATPAAATADSLLGTFPRAVAAPAGATGRTGFILFHTLYGGFLGVAIPAALGASGSEAYGAGLLLGAPAGYFGSRAFSRAKITMPGQAGVAAFATAWGTWQGLALQQVLNIGQREICEVDFCFRDESNEAPWAAMAIGGIAGLTTGLILASNEIPSGTSTLVSHSAFWGSWFGLSAGAVLGAEDDGLVGASLIGGNALLLLAIPAAKSWRPASSRVRLITAAGLAGGLAGFGLDLLTSVEGDGAVLGIPAATSAIGLIAGALATRSAKDADADDDAAASPAFLTVRDGARFRMPLPIPALVPDERQGRRYRPGFRLILLDADF
jgi:hypothetical protein